MNYATINNLNDINIPYGSCLLPSNVNNRQGTLGSDLYGNGTNLANCVPQFVQSIDKIGTSNNNIVNTLNSTFLNGTNSLTALGQGLPQGVPQYTQDIYSNIDLQTPRPRELNKNRYIVLAGQSLHAQPDTLMSIYFSDDNINHLRETVVKNIKDITADSGVGGDKQGITIQTPMIDDFFYYMVNIYQTYKTQNGSICFVTFKNNTNIVSEISKLNSAVLQEYVSKMVSQINMYIYYYKDASQLPEQLSLPVYAAMKGSRSLEYNNGFQLGNSIGSASYDQVGNMI